MVAMALAFRACAPLSRTSLRDACMISSFVSPLIFDAYDLTRAQEGYQQKRMLDEDSIFYDIKMRNSIMSKQNGDDDDDDDLF